MSEETGVIERGQRGSSDTGHQETHSVTHTYCDRTSLEVTDTLSDLSEWTVAPAKDYFTHLILGVCTDSRNLVCSEMTL